MAIYVMFAGELPPRHLPGVDEETTVEKAVQAVREVFNQNGSQRLRLLHDEIELANGEASLGSYGVGTDDLLRAEPVV